MKERLIGFRRRTGIGLPPPGVVVVAHLTHAWGREVRVGKYVPYDKPLRFRAIWNGVFIEGEPHEAPFVMSGFIGEGHPDGVYVGDPRAIEDALDLAETTV